MAAQGERDPGVTTGLNPSFGTQQLKGMAKDQTPRDPHFLTREVELVIAVPATEPL